MLSNLLDILKSKKEDGLTMNIMIEETVSMSLWDDDLKEVISSEFNISYLKESENGFLIENNCESDLTILITDCVSESWSDSRGYNFLENISKKTFFSILNVLPQRMWKRTVLDNTWRIKFPERGELKNSELISNIDEKECGVTEHISVPMMTMDEISFKHWNNLISGEKDNWIYGSLFEKREFLDSKSLSNENISDPMNAKEEVAFFEMICPPMVQHLAIYLSAVELNMEMMKSVQRISLPEANTIGLVEVFLSGLLKKTDKFTTSGEIIYDFIDGVRDVLADKLYEHKRLEIIEEKYVGMLCSVFRSNAGISPKTESCPVKCLNI